MSQIKAKPFLKWAGGKTQLLPTIESFLPEGFGREREITYIEPFVGGGAVLFYLLQKYPNIKKVVINDINPHLINAYTTVKEQPHALIDSLEKIQNEFRSFGLEEQKNFFLDIRHRFNTESLTDIEDASFMIFLNRTCFNGLYRENSKGGFNVPFGRYSNPLICDKDLLLADSRLLQKVDIRQGDFAWTENSIEGYTFFYFDPPYRPLNATSNFNAYVKETFDDNEQIRLHQFVSALSRKGCHVMVSNSDSPTGESRHSYFDELYSDFIIERVQAKRNINSKASGRGMLSELLIRNYLDCRTML